jgi:hypothetical protein
MAKTLEELLKAEGWTDVDLAAQSALLNDPKFRGALEKQYGALETQVNSYKTENAAWAEWHEKHGKPTIELYEKEAVDAKALAASLETRLKEAEKNGFAPRREDSNPNPNPAPVAAQPEPFDPKKHKLVTEDDVAKFADAEGRAIAMASDLSAEYSHLTGGQSLFDYSTEIDGRTLRGMTALRQEAIAAKQPLDQYVAGKFDFAGKRKAISDAQRQKAEDAIRADERSKIIGQYGDPNTRPLMASKEPFMPRPAGDKAVQPWDVPAQDRRAGRLERAMQSQSKGVN